MASSILKEKINEGWEAFEPGGDPEKLNPYKDRCGWVVESFSECWLQGWRDAAHEWEEHND